MSDLRMRTVAAAAAIALPMGLVLAGAASAAGLPDVPVVSDLAGTATGNSISTLPGGNVLGTASGLLGGGSSPTDAVTGVLGGAAAEGALGTVTGAVGGTPAAGVVEKATGVVGGTAGGDLVPGGLPGLELEETLGTVDETLETVTGTVDETLETVTETVDSTLGTVTGVLNNTLGTKTNTSVKPSTDKAAKPAIKTVKEESVATGSLPHTGGDADTTAILLCAGLAVAGAGVTLVTRRRRALGLTAAN